MTFKHRMVTQIVKIGLSLFQSPRLSVFFLKGFVGSDAVELSMETATIVVTAVQVLPNPVHMEICWLSGAWASFTLLKAKLSKQGPLGEESPHHEHCHDILPARFCQKKGGWGFKLTREGKIGENTEDCQSAPQKMVEQPLNCGFAFGMCSNTAHWNMLELTVHPYEIWASENWWRSCRFSQESFVPSQEKGHPFHPQCAVPTSDILYS